MGRKRVWRGTGSVSVFVEVVVVSWVWASGRDEVEVERSWDAAWTFGTASSVKLLMELRLDAFAFRCCSACLMMAEMLPGFELLVMTVVTPALVASLAATIFVLIPPVPSADPAEFTSAVSSAMSSTTSIAFASGFVLGFLSYRQSTSVIKKR